MATSVTTYPEAREEDQEAGSASGRAGRRSAGTALRNKIRLSKGRRRTTTATMLELEGERYLLSTAGEAKWVQTARSAGRVMLGRGLRRGILAVEEVEAGEACRVLQAFAALVPRAALPSFNVTPDQALREFVAEASRHPVFRVVPR